MADLSVRCTCGKETIVSEWAIGAPLRCKACGRQLEATEANTRAVEERPKPAAAQRAEAELPISPEARLASRKAAEQPGRGTTGPAAATPKPAPLPVAYPEPAAPPKPVINNCTRCGREFRGDWDKYHRGDGVYCHVCANLITHEIAREEEAAGGSPSPAAIPEYKGVLDRPNLPQEDDTTPADLVARQERIRRYVIVAAFVTLVVGLGIILSDKTPLPTPDATAVEQAKPLPRSAAIAVFAVMFMFRFVNLTLGLYILLRWKDRLPSDFLVINILWLGAVAMGLQTVGIVLLMVPFLGFFAWLGLCAYILWDLFDLDIADLFMLAVFLMILQPLTSVVRQFALGTIALMFT